MGKRFESPQYNITTKGGEKLTIDVTNSISAGLPANAGLISHLVTWKKKTGASRLLDFGAGALRHTLPLLRAGFEVTAVEYAKAYERPRAAEFKETAERHNGFTRLMWPHDFVKSSHKYDAALLTFVLQVVPTKVDREAILRAIADRLDKNGHKRVYYASRVGEARSLEDDMIYNDGWVRGRGINDRTFYTEWTASETDEFFKQAGFARAGTYSGASQGFIYELPGML